MLLPFNTTIWFYRQPIDFRKQIDGIVILVADTLQKDPVSGQLFVFRNKKADNLKMLYWESGGFWLLYKRFEKGIFKFPGVVDEAMELSMQQLQWLLSGIDFTQQKPPEKCDLLRKKCKQSDEAYAVLMDQLKQMLRHRFGQKSERYIDLENHQLSLYGEVVLNEALDEEDEVSDNSCDNDIERQKKRRAKKSRNTFAAHLPRTHKL